MTEETYQKVCKINNQLSELYHVKKKLSETRTRYLTYAFMSDRKLTERAFDPDDLKPISNILDKHDRMIMDEIEAEIDKLKKQIAEL